MQHSYLVAVFLVFLSACRPAPTATPPQSVGALPETALMPAGAFEVPPGKGLVVLRNFTRVSWQMTMGKDTLDLAPFPPGKGFSDASLAVAPGEYTWQAQSPDLGAGYFVTDEETFTLHRFVIQAGEVYFVRVLSLTPGHHSIPYVVEPVLFVAP